MGVTFTGSVARRVPSRPTRRVREEVRDGLLVIAFSATASTTLAVLLTLAAWAA